MGLAFGILVRPLLEALAKIAGLESTYLTIFDWDRREQAVRFVFSSDETRVKEGHRIPLPKEWTPEAFPGVTRSPLTIDRTQPDSLVARGLGFKTYVSVPVTLAKHRLYGMLCGADRLPRELSETVVSLFESFADVVADQVVRIQTEATEHRAAWAESELTTRARFLAETEHRLKTPLTAVQAVALTLRDHRDELSESQRVQLHDSLVRSVRSLSKEIEYLLAEPRGEDRSRPTSPVSFESEPLVPEIT